MNKPNAVLNAQTQQNGLPVENKREFATVPVNMLSLVDSII
jgi:hypothetical protein